MNIPLTEYNNKYIQPKLMSNVKQMQTPMACVRSMSYDGNKKNCV